MASYNVYGDSNEETEFSVLTSWYVWCSFMGGVDLIFVLNFI